MKHFKCSNFVVFQEKEFMLSLIVCPFKKMWISESCFVLFVLHDVVWTRGSSAASQTNEAPNRFEQKHHH